MKSSNIKIISSLFMFFFVAVSAVNIEAIKAFEILQNVVTTTQPGMIVEGEVRTIDELANPRLWGKGRPNTKRYGTLGVESGLCVAGSIDYGLSQSIVNWGSAAHACPAGTWVCSKDELSSAAAACVTARPNVGLDLMTCDGRNFSAAPGNNWGWLADTHLSDTASGLAMTESMANFFTSYLSCDSLPVWCCSQAP